MIKKLLKVIGILLLLLIAAMFIIPMFFSEEIKTLLTDKINTQINADVAFDDVSLSLFSSFPELSVKISDISVSGRNEFSGIKLLRAGEIGVGLNVMDLITGDGIKVQSLDLINAEMNVKVLSDGKANYDIALPDSSGTTETVETTESSDPLDFKIDKINLQNINLSYDDMSLAVKTEIRGFNLISNGSFNGDVLEMDLEENAESLNLIYEGIPYLKNVKSDLRSKISMNLETGEYKLGETSVNLNDLIVNMAGSMVISEEMSFDLKWNSEQSDFKSLLSLVPGIYQNDFAGISTKGKFSFNGVLSGTYSDTEMPAYEFGLNVNQGYFKYPELPEEAKNIELDMLLKSSGGKKAKTDVLINNFSMELGENPIDCKLVLEDAEYNPVVDGKLNVKLDLASLSKLVPPEEGQKMNGTIISDVSFKGSLNDLEKGIYDKFHAQGKIIALDIQYADKTLPEPFILSKMYLNLSPNTSELASFDCKYMGSDFSFTGRMDNMLNWYCTDATLKGDFKLSSNLIDMNKLYSSDEVEVEENTSQSGEEESVTEAVVIPDNLDISVNYDVRKFIYDNIEAKNCKGEMRIRNQKAEFRNAEMEMMGGNTIMNGSYDSKVQTKPEVKFDVALSGWDMQKSVEQIPVIGKLAPVATYAHGKINSKLSYGSLLNNDLSPDFSSINGNGNLLTDNMVIAVQNTVGKLVSMMGEQNEVLLNNTNLKFKIERGNVSVDPVDFNIFGGPAKFFGSHNIGNNMDYVLSTPVSVKHAKKFIKDIPGIADDAKINLDFNITGPMDNPVIKPALSKNQNLKDVAKEVVKDLVKDKLKDQINNDNVRIPDLNDGKEKLKKQAEDMISNAEKQAATIRVEAKNAAAKVKSEGYKQAASLESNAKNPVAKAAAKKAADKIRKESDSKADGIVKDGDNKADQLIKTARQNADKLLNQ